MKKRTIFTKYSSERAPFLQIRTDIIEDMDHTRYVYKIPLMEEANPHIEKLYVIFKKLSNMYINSDVLINNCIKDNGNLRFDYVEGVSLEEKLDYYLSLNDYQSIIKTIEIYQEKLLNHFNEKPFTVTKDFIDIFGDISMNKELFSLEISNIDLTFGNIITKDDMWYVIDYEWTFNFPIPKKFILYRALCCYLFTSDKREQLYHLNLFQLFGIDKDEMKLYQTMDKNFHRYVMKGNVSLNEIYPSMKRSNYYIADLIKIDMSNKVQVFRDYGNGFSEENSEFINWINIDGWHVLNIEVNSETDAIRVDPTNCSSIIKIKEIWLDENEVSSEGKDTLFWMNGNSIGDDRFYVFQTDDPQIVIPDTKNFKRILIKFLNYNIDENIATQILSNYKLLQDSMSQVKKYAEENKLMVTSTSWKLTKPLRLIKKKLK